MTKCASGNFFVSFFLVERTREEKKMRTVWRLILLDLLLLFVCCVYGEIDCDLSKGDTTILFQNSVGNVLTPMPISPSGKNPYLFQGGIEGLPLGLYTITIITLDSAKRTIASGVGQCQVDTTENVSCFINLRQSEQCRLEFKMKDLVYINGMQVSNLFLCSFFF